jgi:hypothetical protein
MIVIGFATTSDGSTARAIPKVSPSSAFKAQAAFSRKVTDADRSGDLRLMQRQIGRPTSP